MLPLNLLGTRDAHRVNGASGEVAFQKLTISNLARGSDMYWCVLTGGDEAPLKKHVPH